MDLQHADFGELRKHFLPFLGRKLAAGAVELDRIGAIGTLQRTAVGQLGKHRERDAEAFRSRAARFQRCQPIAGIGSLVISENFTHDVFSRACVKNPLSARSCSMATTSVAIASRGAAYLAASSSIIAPTLRTPSQSFSTSTAISSGASTRSGARITQTCRVSSNFNFACRGSTGRLVSLTLMLRGPAIASALTSRSLARRSLARLGHEGARRYMAIDIGMVKGIELDPQHVGLEDQRVAHRFALGRGPGMLLDVFEREAGIARRLLQAAAEIAHDIGIDEIIVLQHAADALFVQVRCEQLGERGGDGFQRRPVAAEMHIGLHRKARRRQNAFGRFHIGAIEPEPLGQLQPALDAALAAEVAVMVFNPVPPFLPDAAIAETRDHDGVLQRDGALVIVAVQRPGLHLALVELAAMQETMKRMQ